MTRSLSSVNLGADIDEEKERVKDEQIMMQIMEHGASIIGIYVSSQGSKPVMNYKKGVIDTCR